MKPPTVDLPLGTARYKKWKPLRGLISGMADGTTVYIRLPNEENIMQKCRSELARIPEVGRNARRFDLRVHAGHDPLVLRVTKVYR